MWETLGKIWTDVINGIKLFAAFIAGKDAGKKEFMDKTETEQAKRIEEAEAFRKDAEALNLQHVKERDAFQRD